MTTKQPISPLGQTIDEVVAEDYERSAAYRAQHNRLAPFRVIAGAVILARGEHGLTQKELADRIGTTDTAISRIESGRHPISLETLEKLGSALGLTFMVGAPQTSLNDRCVAVPETAIERTAAARPRRVLTHRQPASMPSYAFGEITSARVAAKKSR